MRRGELHAYRSISRVRTVLVVSADELNAVGQPITVDVSDIAPTGARALLAVPVAEHGYALVRTLTAADPNRFAEHLGTVDAGTLDAIGMALRAVLDL